MSQVHCIDLSYAPDKEKHLTLSSRDFTKATKVDCQRFLTGLLAKFGNPPEGADLSIKRIYSDKQGRYSRVICKFYGFREEACKYAAHLEKNLPRTWSELEQS